MKQLKPMCIASLTGMSDHALNCHLVLVRETFRVEPDGNHWYLVSTAVDCRDYEDKLGDQFYARHNNLMLVSDSVEFELVEKH